jgi:hypothetical protein
LGNKIKLDFKSMALPILALCGVGLVLFNTHWGPYLSDDTYYYIFPAQELLAGRGFNPSYIFGPLFPLVLAGVSLTGANVLAAARWLNAILFGVNILLVGSITRRLNVPTGFVLLAAALVLLSDVVAEAHGWVMSEALGFTFVLLSLFFFLEFIKNQNRRYWWGMVIAAALAVLTRYASIPLIGAIALALLVFPAGKRFISRLTGAVMFGAISLAPLAMYWVRNQIVSGHPVRYLSFVSVPFTQDQLTWFMYNWFSLFIPGRLLRGNELLAGFIIIAAGLFLVSILVWIYRKSWTLVNGQESKAGLLLLLAFLILNFVMLYIARGFTELGIFNPRYLVPILIVFLLLLVGSAGLLWKAGGRWLRMAIVGFFGILLIYYGFRTVDFSSQVFTTGLGYSNVGWHNSETVAYIEAHSDLTTMVSTGEMGIYFWTQRMPKSLAEFPDPLALKSYMCQTKAPLFVMDQLPTELYGLGHNDVVKALALVREFNDGQMFECPLN